MTELNLTTGVQRKGFLIALLSAFICGIWPACIQFVYRDGGNVSFVFVTSTWLRALSLILFCLITRRALFKSRQDTKQAIISGIIQAISTLSLYQALEYLPGPLVILILFTHTLMLLLFMAMRGERKLDAFTVTITLVALAGLALVLDIWQTPSRASLLGIGFAFTAALATLSRLYMWGKQVTTRHPIVIGAECFLVTAIISLLTLLIEPPAAPSHIKGDFSMLLGASALTISTFATFYGIAILGSFRWSLFLKMEPVFTAIFSAILLDQILLPQQYLGIAVVLISLVSYQVVTHRQRLKLAS